MATNGNTERIKAQRVTGIVVNVILWIFLVFAFVMMIFAFVSNANDYHVPIIGDKVLLNVRTASMEPTIRTGDMIVGTVISAEEKAELQEGDIITYFIDLNGDGTKELNTHRIVEKRVAGETYTFRTKGDNPNSYSDHDVDDGYNVGIDDILCTWKQGDTQIAGLGAVIGFLQSSLGFLLIVIIPLVLLFVYEIVRLIVMIVKIKGKEGNKEISEAEKEEIRRRAIEEYKRSLSQGESAESDNPTEPDKEDAE